jgi:hypothetical protein
MTAEAQELARKLALGSAYALSAVAFIVLLLLLAFAGP